MANREKGEVKLTSGDRIYKLRFTTNAMCELEDLFDMPFAQVADKLQDVQSLRMMDIRKIIWAATQEGVSEWVDPSAATMRAVGAMIEGAGGILPVVDALGDALALAFPDAEDGEPEKTTASKKAT